VRLQINPTAASKLAQSRQKIIIGGDPGDPLQGGQAGTQINPSPIPHPFLQINAYTNPQIHQPLPTNQPPLSDTWVGRPLLGKEGLRQTNHDSGFQIIASTLPQCHIPAFQINKSTHQQINPSQFHIPAFE
jgi:hypothetical protein